MKYLRVKMDKRTYDIPAEFIARQRAEYYTHRDLEKEIGSASDNVSGQPRKFDPMKEGHPMVGQSCFICEKPMEVGDEPTLITTYPSDDDELEKMESGQSYVSVASPAHWGCFLQHKYGEKIDDSIKGEMEYALKETHEIIDWAANNMNWADVRGVAILINVEEDDPEKYWTNSEMEVIEKKEEAN